MTFPSFTGVNHPDFRIDWLLSGLDRLFTMTGDRLDRVSFCLWANYYYDDNSNFDLKGSANFHFVEDGFMTEEELDEIPAVRLLERRAEELWHHCPLDLDNEGNLNGDYSFDATRGAIRFVYNHYYRENDHIVMECVFEDGDWRAREYISLAQYDGCQSDLLAQDAQAVLAHAFNPEDLGLSEMPKAIGVEANDEGVTICLEPGALMQVFAGER